MMKANLFRKVSKECKKAHGEGTLLTIKNIDDTAHLQLCSVVERELTSLFIRPKYSFHITGKQLQDLLKDPKTPLGMQQDEKSMGTTKTDIGNILQIPSLNCLVRFMRKYVAPLLLKLVGSHTVIGSLWAITYMNLIDPLLRLVGFDDVIESLCDITIYSDKKRTITTETKCIMVRNIDGILSQRNINTTDDFVNHLRKKNGAALCIVDRIYMPKQDIKNEEAWIGKVEREGGNPIIEHKDHKTVVIPKDTPIAYGIRQTKVNLIDGRIVAACGSMPVGFEPNSSMDAPIYSRDLDPLDDMMDPLDAMMDNLSPIKEMETEKKRKFRLFVIEVMTNEDDIGYLYELLEIQTAKLEESAENEQSSPRARLLEIIPYFHTDKDSVASFLRMLGFDDQDLDNTEMNALDKLVHASRYIARGLEELTNSELQWVKCLKECLQEETYIKHLADFCKNIIMEKQPSLEISKEIPKDSKAHKVAKMCQERGEMDMEMNDEAPTQESLIPVIDIVFCLMYSFS